MSKFKVGDRVRTTQYVEYSEHKEGEEGTVTEISGSLITVAMDSHNSPYGCGDSTPFTASEIELVPAPTPKYSEGDLLEVTEDFSSQCAVYKKGEFWTVTAASPLEYVLRRDGSRWFAAPETFDVLTTVRKASKEPKPMVQGGKYWNPAVEDWYTVTSIDWERERVDFVFGKDSSPSDRTFGAIKHSFPGYCAPLPTEEVSTEALPSEDRLREAAEFLGADFNTVAQVIELAGRLK